MYRFCDPATYTISGTSGTHLTMANTYPQILQMLREFGSG